MKSVRGFTLIELMIVIAIVGILATFAIPAYQAYIIRTQAAEGLALANGYKSTVGDIFLDEGTFNNINNSYLDIPLSSSIYGHYTSAIEFNQGIMLVQYGRSASAELAPENMRLSPVASSGSLQWVCSYNGDQSHAPKACRN